MVFPFRGQRLTDSGQPLAIYPSCFAAALNSHLKPKIATQNPILVANRHLNAFLLQNELLL